MSRAYVNFSNPYFKFVISLYTYQVSVQRGDGHLPRSDLLERGQIDLSFGYLFALLYHNPQHIGPETPIYQSADVNRSAAV